MLFLVGVFLLMILFSLTFCGRKKKKTPNSNYPTTREAPKEAPNTLEPKIAPNAKGPKVPPKPKEPKVAPEIPAPKVASPKNEQKSEKKEKPQKESEKKEKSKKDNSKLENSQKTQASFSEDKLYIGNASMNREVHQIQVHASWISITEGDFDSGNSSSNHLDLNKKPQTAQKELAAILKAFSKINGIYFGDCNMELDDEIIQELIRIKFQNMDLLRSRITAGHVQIEQLLTKNPKKIRFRWVHVQPSIVTDRIMSLLTGDIQLISLSLNGGSDVVTPTSITDSFLMDYQSEIRPLLLQNFYHPKLSFPAIKEFFKATNCRLKFRQRHYLGVIGYQEMSAILQYYHEKTWIEWNSTIFNIDNISDLQFHDIFTEIAYKQNEFGEPEKGPKFCISLDRDSNGKVDFDKISVPEEFIVANTFSNFKALVQVIQSDSPLESIAPASIGLDFLEIHFNGRIEVCASIIQKPNMRNQKSHPIVIRRSNINMVTAEEIFVKIFRICSTIEFSTERKTNIILNDKLFTLLYEHAKDTEITKEWSLDTKLSAENLVRLRENQGLFKMFKLNEASKN